MTTVGQRLRRERLRRNLSQEALAAQLGTTARSIRRWEAGMVLPQPHQRLRYCELFGANVDELFPGADRSDGARTTSSGSLPVPSNPLVGRTKEVAHARHLLRPGGPRLVSLTGPPGVGKTRLALEVARQQVARFPDGVLFVDLAPVADPELVGSAILRALGLRDAAGETDVGQLLAHLARRSTLLVLDNFEHVLAAAPLVAELLARCPGLRLLVTSRAALRVTAEHELEVPPLPLPDPGGAAPVAELGPAASVALFLQRANAAAPGVVLDERTAASVAEICRRLDGLPLALELAAGWTRLLDFHDLLVHLDRRLPMLETAPRDLPERQRTMRGTLRWSYDLLGAGEQALFRRLSVFPSGAGVDAVAAVCQAAGPLDGDILELLAGLAEKHLVRRARRASEAGVAMLETVREYASERLAASGEAEATICAHAGWFEALVRRAQPELTGRDQARWLSRLEREHDNLRAALRWWRDSGRTGTALEAAGYLWRFWYRQGHLREGRDWLTCLLRSADGVPAHVRALGELAAGSLAWPMGDQQAAAAHFEASLALYEAGGDRAGVASALNGLGAVAHSRADYPQATAHYLRSLALRRELGDQWGLALALHNLAVAARGENDLEHARTRYGEALATWRSVGDRHGVALCLSNLGELAMAAGDHERAVGWLLEAASLCRESGDDLTLLMVLVNLADARAGQLDDMAAQELYTEALWLCDKLGGQSKTCICLEGLATVCAMRGRHEEAVRIRSAAAALRQVIGVPLEPVFHAKRDHELADARRALGERCFSATWSAGQRLTAHEAIAEALDAVRTERGTTSR